MKRIKRMQQDRFKCKLHNSHYHYKCLYNLKMEEMQAKIKYNELQVDFK